jgi:hypothetical protein
MEDADIRLILKDLDPHNLRIIDIYTLMLYIYLLTRNIRSIRVKPIIILFLPILLKCSHFTGDLYTGIAHYIFDTYDIPILQGRQSEGRTHHANALSLEYQHLLYDITDIMPYGIPMFMCNLHLSECAETIDSDLLRLLNVHNILSNIIMCSERLTHRLAHRRNHEYSKEGIKQFYIPDFVKWLQDNELILSNKHHSKHHATEIVNYGLANGSSSALVDKITYMFDLDSATYATTNNIRVINKHERSWDIIPTVRNIVRCLL